jgi:hypothetical protein
MREREREKEAERKRGKWSVIGETKFVTGGEII